MLDDMTLSKGRSWSAVLSFVRYSSALIASSPRTAYSTLRSAGFRDSMVRGAISRSEVDAVDAVDNSRNEAIKPRVL